jgi:8-oxo-dGTP pyrophosphatase MutT (NUDIX family)
MAKFMLIRPLWIIRNYILRILNYPSIGARALVVKDDEVLLIRHTYEGGWFTVGGAVDKNESFIQAAIRELKEEVGLTSAIQPGLFGVYLNRYFGRDDYIAFYIVKEFTIEEVYSTEIAEKKWFKFTDLPENISPATRRRIEEYLGQREKSERW